MSARQDRSRRVDLHRASDVRDLFDPDDLDAMSVLSSIVSVTQATANHRRLVYDVYKDGHLARMLGLDPPTGSPSSQVRNEDYREKRVPRGSREDRKRKADSVTQAWDKVDTTISSEDERPRKRKRKATRDESEESESRYHVSHRRNGNGKSITSPRKRQRTSSKQDVHQAPAITTFVSSDDDDDDDEKEDGEIVEESPVAGKPLSERVQVNLVSDGELEDIEAEYERETPRSRSGADRRNGASDRRRHEGDVKARQREASVKSESRRAFWASKGLPQSDSDGG